MMVVLARGPAVQRYGEVPHRTVLRAWIQAPPDGPATEYATHTEFLREDGSIDYARGSYFRVDVYGGEKEAFEAAFASFILCMQAHCVIDPAPLVSPGELRRFEESIEQRRYSD